MFKFVARIKFAIGKSRCRRGLHDWRVFKHSYPDPKCPSNQAKSGRRFCAREDCFAEQIKVGRRWKDIGMGLYESE